MVYKKGTLYYNNFNSITNNFNTTWPESRDLGITNVCNGCNFSPSRLMAEGTINSDMKVLDGSNLNRVSLTATEKQGNVSLRAGSSIILTTGFKVESRAYFRGYIYPFYCNDSLSIFQRKRSTIQEIEEKLISSENELNIYPNPTSGTFKLEYGVNRDLIDKIEIYDSQGQLQFRKENLYSGQELDVDHLSNGIFLIRAYTQKGVKVKRLILSR